MGLFSRKPSISSDTAAYLKRESDAHAFNASERKAAAKLQRTATGRARGMERAAESRRESKRLAKEARRGR